MSNQQDRERGAAARLAEDLDAKRRLRLLVQGAVDTMEPIHPLTVADVLLALAAEAVSEDLTVTRPYAHVAARHASLTSANEARRSLSLLRQEIGLAP